MRPRKKFRVLRGLNYPAPDGKSERRACPEGECLHPEDPALDGTHPSVVDDLPAISLPWLLEDGLVEEVTT